MRIALLLLAAGTSSRMGGADKLLMEVAGRPCLRTMALRGLKANLDVFVTLPPDRPARRDALAGLDITPVPVPDAIEGMSQSLRAGIAALPAHADAAMILPADMPDITSADMLALKVAFGTDPAPMILRATTEDGSPGHPIIFSRRLFDEFKSLAGDRGAHRIVQQHSEQTRLCALPGQRARTDLDTPGDWAEWRARQP